MTNNTGTEYARALGYAEAELKAIAEGWLFPGETPASVARRTIKNIQRIIDGATIEEIQKER